MKTGLVMVAGIAVLSLATGGSATADTSNYHHRHHATKSRPVQVPAASQAAFTSEDNHNPAKKYPTRHMPEGAIKTSTLATNGNNPAKPYAVRHAPENASRDSTLPTNGNNPAKRYPNVASTAGAASR